MKYFYIDEKNNEVGPVEMEVLIKNITPNTLVCREGTQYWQRAEDIEKIKSNLTTSHPELYSDKSENTSQPLIKKIPNIFLPKGRMRRSVFFGNFVLIGSVN